jgi:membrane-associated phospholipid phosphatase
MAATRSAPPAPSPGGGRLSRRRRRLLTVAGLATFVAGSAIAVDRNGLFLRKDAILLWMLAGLLALSLTDLRRWGRGVLFDWLPLAVLLVFYDTSRDISERLGMPVHEALQIRFDEGLFGTPLLTARLQQAFHETSAVRFWEYPMFAVYMTHFFAGVLVAGILWRYAYPRFRAFRAQLVTLTTLGFATYVLYPARPPWMVADLGGLPPIHRSVFDVWGHVGLQAARSTVEQGSAFDNDVAAVPSMHAAVTLMILLFFWPRAAWWARTLLVGYVLAMAWTLVYSGEHYVFDIVLGWLYAVAVAAGAALIRRRRRLRRSSPTADVPTITETRLERGLLPEGP